MKYSKTAIGLLTAQYRSVLKKCLMINLGLFALGAVAATPANAADTNTWAGAINETDAFMDGLAASTGGAWDRQDGVVTGWGVDQILTIMGTTAANTDAAVALVNDTTKGNEALYTAIGTKLTGTKATSLDDEGANSFVTASQVKGAGYITSSALSPYLTSETAASTYATQTALSAKQDALSSAQISRINGAVVGAKINGGSTIAPDENGILALTDANTEYSAGNGLALTGTTFSVKPTTTNSGLSVTDAGVAVSGITDANVDSISAGKISGLGTMATASADDYYNKTDANGTFATKTELNGKVSTHSEGTNKLMDITNAGGLFSIQGDGDETGYTSSYTQNADANGIVLSAEKSGDGAGSSELHIRSDGIFYGTSEQPTNKIVTLATAKDAVYDATHTIAQAIAAKQDALTPGSGINISEGTISASGIEKTNLGTTLTSEIEGKLTGVAATSIVTTDNGFATAAQVAGAIASAGEGYVTNVAASADTADDGTIAVTKNGTTTNVAVKGWASKADATTVNNLTSSVNDLSSTVNGHNTTLTTLQSGASTPGSIDYKIANATIQASKVNGLAAIATSGSYADLSVADGAIAQAKVNGLTTALDGKVDAVEGKGLSTNDYTNADKAIVDSALTTTNYADTLGSVYVAQEEGKGLSTNDYSNADKEKLGGIATGAQVNTIEGIKVNGTAVAPDADKIVDITAVTGIKIGDAGEAQTGVVTLGTAAGRDIADEFTPDDGYTGADITTWVAANPTAVADVQTTAAVLTKKLAIAQHDLFATGENAGSIAHFLGGTGTSDTLTTVIQGLAVNAPYAANGNYDDGSIGEAIQNNASTIDTKYNFSAIVKGSNEEGDPTATTPVYSKVATDDAITASAATKANVALNNLSDAGNAYIDSRANDRIDTLVGHEASGETTAATGLFAKVDANTANITANTDRFEDGATLGSKRTVAESIQARIDNGNGTVDADTKVYSKDVTDELLADKADVSALALKADLTNTDQTITAKAYKTANWTASEGITGNLLLQSGGKNAAILRADGSFTLNGTNGQVFDVAKDGKITSNSDLVLGYKTDNQATLTGAKVKSYDAAVADLPNKYNFSAISTADNEEATANTAVYSALKTDALLGELLNKTSETDDATMELENADGYFTASGISGSDATGYLSSQLTVNSDEKGIVLTATDNRQGEVGKTSTLEVTSDGVFYRNGAQPSDKDEVLTYGTASDGAFDADGEYEDDTIGAAIQSKADASDLADYAKLDDDTQTITSKAYVAGDWKLTQAGTGSLILGKAGAANAVIFDKDLTSQHYKFGTNTFESKASIATEGNFRANGQLTLGYGTNDQAILTGAKIKAYDAAVEELPNKYNWSNITGAEATDTAGAETVTADTNVYSVAATDQAIQNALSDPEQDIVADNVDAQSLTLGDSAPVTGTSGRDAAAIALDDNDMPYVADGSDATLATTASLNQAVNNVLTFAGQTFNAKQQWLDAFTGLDSSKSNAEAFEEEFSGDTNLWVGDGQGEHPTNLAGVFHNINSALGTIHGLVNADGSVNNDTSVFKNGPITSELTGEEISTSLRSGTSVEELEVDLDNAVAKIRSGETMVGKAFADKDGNEIDTTYATKDEAMLKVDYLYEDTDDIDGATIHDGTITGAKLTDNSVTWAKLGSGVQAWIRKIGDADFSDAVHEAVVDATGNVTEAVLALDGLVGGVEDIIGDGDFSDAVNLDVVNADDLTDAVVKIGKLIGEFKDYDSPYGWSNVKTLKNADGSNPSSIGQAVYNLGKYVEDGVVTVENTGVQEINGNKQFNGSATFAKLNFVGGAEVTSISTDEISATPSKTALVTEYAVDKAISDASEGYVKKDDVVTAYDSTISDTNKIYSATVVNSELAKKQDVIEDLDDIREGAALGATSVQGVSGENYLSIATVDDVKTIVAGKIAEANLTDELKEKIAKTEQIGDLSALHAITNNADNSKAENLVVAINNFDDNLHNKANTYTATQAFTGGIKFSTAEDVQVVSDVDVGGTAVTVDDGDPSVLATTATVMKSAQNAEFTSEGAESLGDAATIKDAINALGSAVDENAGHIGDVDFSEALNIETTTTDLTSAAKQLDTAIGDRTYEEENVVESGEAIADSINALDKAVGDMAFEGSYTKDADGNDATNLTEAINNVAVNAEAAADKAKQYTDDRMDGTGAGSEVTLGSKADTITIGKENEDTGLTGIEVDTVNKKITAAVNGNGTSSEIAMDEEGISMTSTVNGKSVGIDIANDDEGRSITMGDEAYGLEIDVDEGTTTIGSENGEVVIGEGTIKTDGDVTVGAEGKQVVLSAEDGSITTDGDATIGGSATVAGDLSAASGNFTVVTTTTTGDEPTSTTTMTLTGDADISGDTSIGGGLDVAGDVTVGEDAVVIDAEEGSVTTAGDVTVGAEGTQVVLGAEDGSITADGDVTVGAEGKQVVLSAEDGSITTDGDATIGGNESVAGTLDVDGATTLGDTLDVDGKTTLSEENGLAFGEGPTVTGINDGSEAVEGDGDAATLATTATLMNSAENAKFTGATDENHATGEAETIKQAFQNIDTFVGSKEALTNKGISDKADLTTAFNSFADNIEAGMGGEFAEGGEWSAEISNEADAPEDGYYSAFTAENLADAISTVYSTIGTADNLQGYNGVSAENTVNDNIAAVNETVGDFGSLKNEFGNLSSYGEEGSQAVEPEDITAALDNIDATFGRIHGLFDGEKVNTTGGIESTTGSHSNLAKGTTVEMHLVSLDNAIGDRSSITNENGSNGYVLVERDSVADVLSDIASQIGTAEELAGATINGVSADNTVNANIAAINSSLGDISELKDAAFAQGATLVDAVKNVDDKLVNLDNRVAKTEKDLKELHHDFRRGMASMAAMSALVPNSRSTGKTSLSLGTGAYGGHGAVAVGGFHYITDNLMLNAGVSWSDSSDAAYRMGVTYSF